MPSVKLVASTYSVTGSVTVSNPDRMYTDVSSTTYATLTHTTSGTTSYYCYIKGFDFSSSSVPSNANVSSIVIRIRGYESGLSTSTTYAPRLYNGTNTISGASTASANFGTSASTITVPYTGSWDTLKNYGSNLGIRVTIRRSNRNTQGYLYIYGAEIEVTYTVPADIHVTGVTLDKATDSIEVGETTTLTETIAPSNATNKSVTWSTSNSSVATVSGGVVAGVSTGTARITVTTVDGGYTAYCDVTVTAPVLTTYYPATEMTPGNSYLIANGSSGTVYLLTDESGGSRTLVGVAATISNGVIQISGSVASRTLFECVRYTSGNDNTITVRKDSKYLYCDNSNGLRMNAPTTLDRFWHFRDNKFWQFKSTAADGYTDASTEYKYYLQWSGGNATDNHVTSPSIEDSNIPLVYIFTDAPSAPVITVGTPSRSIISDESGVNQCVCTFSSNLALQAWEARATKGVTPARGVGLLVESGTTLAAGATGTVVVDWDELTNGDGEYTITVYGQSTDGVWSA